MRPSAPFSTLLLLAACSPADDLVQNDSALQMFAPGPCGSYDPIDATGATWSFSSPNAEWRLEATGQESELWTVVETGTRSDEAATAWSSRRSFLCDADGVWLVEDETADTLGDGTTVVTLVLYEQPMLLHPLTMAYGVAWTAEYSGNVYKDGAWLGATSGQFEGLVVNDQVEIDVGAGTFSAIEVERAYGEVVQRTWYAAGVGLVATPSSELVSYGP